MQNHSKTKTKDFMTNLTKQQAQVKEYFETKDNTKGLLLYGPNGTGKTTSMSPYLKKMWHGSAIDYANVVAQNGRNYITRYAMHDMYIDDLGREPVTVKSFGDDINVMHDLIHYRYSVFQKNGHKTHISTNLGFNELQERYGIAIVDRIKEMCSIIEFKGESLRA